MSAEETIAAITLLRSRCKGAGIPMEESGMQSDDNLIPGIKVGMKCGRNVRWVYLNDDKIQPFLDLPFEQYTFLDGFEAISSPSAGTIEAGLRPSQPFPVPTSFLYRRLFGRGESDTQIDAESMKISLPATREGFPDIEISQASEPYKRLCRTFRNSPITLKLAGCRTMTHDAALALLIKAAGTVLFQIDLLTDVPMSLWRRRLDNWRRPKKPARQVKELQYPQMEFDNAPLSLYWYARSASGIPLLQFLAFYQVMEFYFPIYSKSEAQRKLKRILKDPTFRIDRDTDVARLLSAIQMSRSGAFGDEKSQLRATLSECVDRDELRKYLEADSERKDYFSTKGKVHHKIPLANSVADLRNDVADRIYDIRCKIVHTKSDLSDSNIELLLPFSPEAEQLTFDIELIQYLAQSVLVAGSTPFNLDV